MNTPSRPYTKDEVSAVLGSDWRCPYCSVESVSNVEYDIGWVRVPIRTTPPRFFCLGCFFDFDSACTSNDFADHPISDLIKAATDEEGVATEEFRRLFLEQELGHPEHG